MNIWSYFFKDPVMELYRFHCGNTVYCFAATSNDTITWNNETYEPAFITRSALHYSSDFAKDVLTVTVASDNPLAELFFTGTPDFLIRLTVYRGTKHGTSYQPVWVGLVNGATFSFDSGTCSCELACETAASRMERLGLARNYQLTCPHTLYGSKCGVDRGSFASIRTVTAVSGFSITVNGAVIQNGWYLAGQAVAASGARRFISSNTGNVLTLERSMGLKEGDVVTLYPGCDKSRQTCIGKFGNGRAYGGFPWLPTTSPYTSTIG